MNTDPLPLAGKRVLVVEDEPLIAMDYASHLTEAGAQVIGTFASVRDAMRFLKSPASASILDAAVVDFVLAYRNSEPLQVALKQRHIPFVVVSAYPRPLVRTEVSERRCRQKTLCDELGDACRAA